MSHTRLTRGPAYVPDPTPSLAVFTDLDGTLLDHDTYDWLPAAPSLDALRAARVPVVLISSKTLAELEGYRAELALPHPVVAENGAVIDVPPGPLAEVWQPPANALTRHAVQQVLDQLRRALGVRCRAFFELGPEGIAAATGLPPAQAELANTRQASEPLLWEDSDAALAAFASEAAARGLRAVRGGRFVHLMGAVDKAQAMRLLLEAYARLWPQVRLTSVALGDSPNDLEMLRAADIAVVVPNRRDGGVTLARALASHTHLLQPGLAGPSGWHSAMQSILANQEKEYFNGG